MDILLWQLCNVCRTLLYELAYQTKAPGIVSRPLGSLRRALWPNLCKIISNYIIRKYF